MTVVLHYSVRGFHIREDNLNWLTHLYCSSSKEQRVEKSFPLEDTVGCVECHSSGLNANELLKNCPFYWWMDFSSANLFVENSLWPNWIPVSTQTGKLVLFQQMVLSLLAGARDLRSRALTVKWEREKRSKAVLIKVKITFKSDEHQGTEAAIDRDQINANLKLTRMTWLGAHTKSSFYLIEHFCLVNTFWCLLANSIQDYN